MILYFIDFSWWRFLDGLFPFMYVWLMNNLAIAYFWSALQLLMATKFVSFLKIMSKCELDNYYNRQHQR